MTSQQDDRDKDKAKQQWLNLGPVKVQSHENSFKSNWTSCPVVFIRFNISIWTLHMIVLIPHLHWIRSILSKRWRVGFTLMSWSKVRGYQLQIVLKSTNCNLIYWWTNIIYLLTDCNSIYWWTTIVYLLTNCNLIHWWSTIIYFSTNYNLIYWWSGWCLNFSLQEKILFKHSRSKLASRWPPNFSIKLQTGLKGYMKSPNWVKGIHAMQL